MFRLPRQCLPTSRTLHFITENIERGRENDAKSEICCVDVFLIPR